MKGPYLSVLLAVFCLHYCWSFSAVPSTTGAASFVALEPKPHYPCLSGEKWPRPHALKTRSDEIQERRLASRVKYLENIVENLCSALVYCDDMALLEREMLKTGDIHLDMSSNMTRRPLLLRKTVADIARQNGQPVKTPVHHWS